MPIRHLLLLAATIAGCAAFVFWGQRHQISTLRCQAWADRQADERLLAQLDEMIAADGRELMLADLPAYFEEQIGVPLELDEPRLTDAGIDPGAAAIILPEGRVSGRAILAHALLQCELWYEPSRGRIRITTPEQIETHEQYLAVYPAPQPGLTASTTEDEWRDIVSSTIAPQSWDEVGGPGHIEAVPGGLAIVQSRQVQQQIGELFATLGKMENPPRSWKPVRLFPPGPTAAEARIHEALEEMVSLDVTEEPLNVLVSNLSVKHGVPIVLCDRKLEEAGVSTDTPVTKKLSNVPLKSALQAVLEELELTQVVRHEMVRITTPEDAESQLATVAYPVHDLVTYPDAPNAPDFDSLIELINTTIAPQSWDVTGGPGSGDGVAGGWLILSQTDEVHIQIAELLSLLRHALSESGPRPLPLGDSPLEQRIVAALETEIDFEYPGTTLADICSDLSSQLGICVRLCPKKFEEAGINYDTPVICSFPRARLRVQLRRLCEALDLGFCTRGEMLCLTSPEDAESSLTTRVYDVRPLIDPDLGLTHSDGLIDLVTTHVQPHLWDEVGGPGAISDFRGLLIVLQNSTAHHQVACLLQQLETHCLPRVQLANADPSACIPADPDHAELLAALRQPVNVSFCGVPLSDALAELAAAHQVPITIKLNGLWESSVEKRTIVSYSTENLPLGLALEELLMPLGLCYRLESGQLLVSSKSDYPWSTCLYPVADLLARDGGDSREPLQLRIMTEVAPQEWDQAGGPNSLSLIGDRWLDVSGSAPLQMHLCELLDRQRQNRPYRYLGPPSIPIAFRNELFPMPSHFTPDPSPEEQAWLDAVDSRLLIGACELSLGFRPATKSKENPFGEPKPPASDDPFAPAADDPFATEPNPFAEPQKGARP